MSTDTPITDDVLTHNVGYANYQLDMLVNESRKLERENARLREEVEMLNVRHAAAMLHAQTHADKYNALREELALTAGTLESRERNIATLQEELAEAKGSKPCCQDWDNCTERCIPLQQEWRHRAEQAEARSLAAEKDAGRLDYVLQNCAFIDSSKTDAGTTVYVLMNQDEDENFHNLSGKSKFFSTTRDAIDAAIGASDE